MIDAITAEGPGSEISYRAASGLERALADVEVQRMQGIPARLITDNIDPLKVQSGAPLQYLAYELGVTLWEPAWDETTKREWLSTQWKFKSLVGTQAAIIMALGINRFTLDQVVRPPGGFYAGDELTAAQQNAYTRMLPQLRIKYAAKTAIDFLDALFCGDGAADDQFFTPDFGRDLLGREAVLRHSDGTETALAIGDGGTLNGSQIEFVAIPGNAGLGFMADADFFDDDRYATLDDAGSNLYSYALDRSYTLGPFDTLSALPAGLVATQPYYEQDSDTPIDNTPAEFSDDGAIDDAFIMPDLGGELLADRVYLVDSSVSVPLTANVSFMDEDRIGMPSDYAELLIDTHTLLPVGEFCDGDNFVEDSFVCPEDLSDIERAMRAVVAAKRLADVVPVSFEPRRPLEFGDVFTEETLATDWLPNRL